MLVYNVETDTVLQSNELNNSEGILNISADIIPSIDNKYDIGNTNNYVKDLYIVGKLNFKQPETTFSNDSTKMRKDLMKSGNETNDYSLGVSDENVFYTTVGFLTPFVAVSIQDNVKSTGPTGTVGWRVFQEGQIYEDNFDLVAQSFANYTTEDGLTGFTGPSYSLIKNGIWKENGNNIYYNNGIVGIGSEIVTGNYKLQVNNSDALINNITVGRGSGNIDTNTVIGYQALYSNTSGNNNIGNGYQSLYNNTTGFGNNANGYQSLYKNTNGNNNIANGYQSLFYNTAGSNNIATGNRSLFYNTVGSDNIANGNLSLYLNTTGNYNIANGYYSLYKNIDGSYNIANGNYSLYSNTCGNYNIANGYSSLYLNTTGNYNIAIGHNSNNTTTTGSNVITIGKECNPSSATVSDEITLGNGSIKALRCQVTTITGLSDFRDKKDIKPLNIGLEFIDKLKPVEFVWNTRDGNKIDTTEFGFIAQDLQETQKELDVVVPGLVYDINPDKLEASYGTLIPVMVKAIQDLSNKNDLLYKLIQELNNKNEILFKEIQELKIK